MDKIPSFNIDHTRLEPGIFVSRQDKTPSGDTLTTFDIRMTRPNRDDALSPKSLHAMEHLVATFLRNHDVWKEKIVYWGPMGCCTGNYLIVQGDKSPEDILCLIREAMAFVKNFEGDIPGATAKDCGNYTFMDLQGARKAAARFLKVLEHPNHENLNYPS